MSIHIRLMQAADLPLVLTIQNQAYDDLVEEEAVIKSRLIHAPDFCWVAELNSEVCAYLLTHPWDEELPPAWNMRLETLTRKSSTFYIHDLALGESAQGHGIARSLIETALEYARKNAFKEAQLISVQSSIGFWERMGFSAAELNEALNAKLSTYGDDARLMSQQL